MQGKSHVAQKLYEPEWLKREINEAWEKRKEIRPSCKSMPRPGVLSILKLLPKTNCQDCGVPTCMVFATRLAEGFNSPEDCKHLDGKALDMLAEYLKPFSLELIQEGLL